MSEKLVVRVGEVLYITENDYLFEYIPEQDITGLCIVTYVDHVHSHTFQIKSLEGKGEALDMFKSVRRVRWHNDVE